MIKNKKALEFSFAWMFSLIVGAAILFFAIFFSSSLIKNERTIYDSQSAKEFGILLNPIETGIESGYSTKISFPQESRIFNDCDSFGAFGKQKISVSTKSGFGEKWQEQGVPSFFSNKYLFSEKYSEGKDFFVFSKSFEFPFKVADAIFLLTDKEKYCFINSPTEISEELNSLNIKNIEAKSSISECSKNSKKVCFASSGCEVDVSINSKSVSKKGKIVYYEDSLIYGAIFSSPEIYECQVKRLLSRASQLSDLYLEKSKLLASKGCNSNLEPELIAFSNSTKIKNSNELRKLVLLSDALKRRNDDVSCQIF